MKTQRIELRENGKYLFPVPVLFLFAALVVGFVTYRKAVPPTPQGYEVAAR